MENFVSEKNISRDEKLSAINAFFDEMLPSVGGVQPGGILTQSLTRERHSALTFDDLRNDLLTHDESNFREHEKLNGYATSPGGDTLWMYLNDNQLENLCMSR